MWIHRRSSEPSPTEVQCYWKKSVLSSVATSIKYKTMRELTGHEPTINENELDNSTFFADVIKEAKEKQLDSQLSRHNFQLKTREEYELSLHRLLVHFNATGESNAENFLDFASNRITQNLCKKAEVQTQNQSNNVLWHELRYGRITASKLYEAAHCTTSKGTFVNTVIGAAKVFDTLEMERGRILEKEVIQVAADKLNFTYKDCGFVIKPNYPVIGASPDAITDQFVIEVKCPNSDKALNKFLPKGELNSKCKAQINLQMFATGLLKGLFIVASPDFEKSKKISLKWVDYDKKYTFTLIDQAMDFWKINIYPILLNSVTE